MRFHLHEMCKIEKSMETQGRLEVARNWGVGTVGGPPGDRYEVSIWGDAMSYISSGDVCTTTTTTKTLNCTL